MKIDADETREPTPEKYVDGRYADAREQKVAEWRTKGYPEPLIEKTLKWADEWCRGTAKRFIKDPVMQVQVEQSLGPEALELSDRFIIAMAQ